MPISAPPACAKTAATISPRERSCRCDSRSQRPPRAAASAIAATSTTIARPMALVSLLVFDSLLVANRGEIARRVLRTAARMGLRTIAVHSEADADLPFVHEADEAGLLAPPPPAQSYLDVARVLEAAKRTGADAVHPGYGFLSERAEFAQAVIDAGLVWVGPAPAVITALGDKVEARRIAAQVGAPLVKGSDGPLASAADAVAFAKEAGLPLAIKAAFGGGGRGMKVARKLEEVGELFESAVREAIEAFGRGECYAEQFLDKPRHIEAQVIA